LAKSQISALLDAHKRQLRLLLLLLLLDNILLRNRLL
jgi:hypothetical protein